jgi:hypothetical protein
MEAHEEPMFLVDRTAGRLARWLRVLGFDVDYADTCEVSAIARWGRRTGRTVLTRNRELAERMGASSILIMDEHLTGQLRQVVEQVGVDACKPFTRCNICNARLKPVPRDSISGRVPDYVYSNHERFSTCPVCGRYYWHGTHWESMNRKVNAILEGVGDGDTGDQDD